MALSDDDYERAAVLYGYLCGTALVSADDTEVVFASNKASADINDLISIEYLTQSGVTLEDYGYTQDSYETISRVKSSIFISSIDSSEFGYSENKRASVEITGTGELDAHSKFIGTIFNGVSRFDINCQLP